MESFITVNVVWQLHKAVWKMNILNLNILRNIKIHMSKVPYCLDACLNKSVGHWNCLLLGDCENRDIDIVLLDKILDLFYRTYLNIAYHLALKSRVTVKCTLENKSSCWKIGITRQSCTKITRSYNDELVLLVNAKYLTDLIIQILYIIAISLLSKSTEWSLRKVSYLSLLFFGTLHSHMDMSFLFSFVFHFSSFHSYL